MSTAEIDLHAQRSSRGEAQPASAVLAEWVYRYRFIFFAFVGVLYLLAFNGKWQIEPDSALYLELGKNISLGHGFAYHGAPDSLAYPGLPYALALVFKIFGTHAIFAADVMILLCGFAGFACTYRLVYLAYDRNTAAVVALGVAVCHEVFRYCYEIMTDVPFFTGVMAFLAGYQSIFGANENRGRRWWDWALLVGGFAIFFSTRPTMLGLVGVAFIAMIVSAITRPASRRLVFPMLIVAAIALAGFLAFESARGSAGPSTYEKYAVYVFTHDLQGHLHQQLPDNLRELFLVDLTKSMIGMRLGRDWINAINAGILLVAGLALCRKQLIWGLWIGVTFLMLAFFVSHDRYVLQILPLLVIAWWRLISWLNHYLNARLGRYAGNILFVLLLFVGTVPNFIEDVHVILEQRAVPFYAHYKEGRYPPYLAMANEIPKYAASDQIVLCPLKLSRIMTFLSDRNVYESDEFNNPPPGLKLLIVMDPQDWEFQQWLASEKIELDPLPPIATTATASGRVVLEYATAK